MLIFGTIWGISILVLNVTYYRIKYILSKHGIKTYLFFHPFGETDRFRELIKSIEDPGQVKSCKLTLRIFSWSLIIFFASLIMTLVFEFYILFPELKDVKIKLQ